MGLIKENGNYVKITSIRTDNDTAELAIYQNEAARDRELAGTWSEFDVKKSGSFNTAVIPEIAMLAPALTFKGIYDNFKTMVYILMLCDLSAFPNAELDQETKDEIKALTGTAKTEFETAVDFLLEERKKGSEGLTVEQIAVLRTKIFG